jgi:hypothetical protein
MRQGSLVEVKGDTFTLNILLTNTGNDLRNICDVTLRSSNDHGSNYKLFLQIEWIIVVYNESQGLERLEVKMKKKTLTIKKKNYRFVKSCSSSCHLHGYCDYQNVNNKQHENTITMSTRKSIFLRRN